MNFVEKHSKLLAVALCLCASGPILSTVHAYEVQPGWHTEGESSYYVLDNHKRAKGLTVIDDEKYFFDTHGMMQFGWQNVDNQTFFFDNSGKAVTGKAEIQGTTYNFLGTGALASGWMEDGTYHNEKGFKVANQWVNDDNGKYYVNEEGSPVTNTWETIDGNDYYFQNDGRTAIGEVQSEAGTFYSDDQGIVKTGFQPLEGAMAYYNDNGTINMDNYKEIDDVTYAFNTDGTLLTNTQRDGFVINESGAVLTPEGTPADIESVPVIPQPEVAPTEWIGNTEQEVVFPSEEVVVVETPVESHAPVIEQTSQVDVPTEPVNEESQLSPEPGGPTPEPVAPIIEEEPPVSVSEEPQIAALAEPQVEISLEAPAPVEPSQPEAEVAPLSQEPAVVTETAPVGEEQPLGGTENTPIVEDQSVLQLEIQDVVQYEIGEEEATMPAPIAVPGNEVIAGSDGFYVAQPEVGEENPAPVGESPDQGYQGPAPVADDPNYIPPEQTYTPVEAPIMEQPVYSGKAATIYAAALSQLGVIQDCTSLVTNSLAAAGVYFHGWPEEYACVGTWTSDPIPGDIVIYSGHVAVYAGNGMAVHGGWNGYTTALASINCSQALIGFIRVS